MATPVTAKKLEEKIQKAKQRKEKENNNQQNKDKDQLLSLSTQTDAPSSHLLVRSEPLEGAPPRQMDLRPLRGNYTNYRERKEDFSTDVSDARPYGLLHYTSFESGGAGGAEGQLMTVPGGYPPAPPTVSMDQALQTLSNVLQPLSRPNNYYNQRQKQYGDRLNVANVKKQAMIVVPIPDDMPTWEIIVHPDKLVCFHGKTNFLSQLYPVTLIVDGNEYQSMEHYYQACKLFSLVGAQSAQELRSIKDPLKAKTRTRELLHRMAVTNDKIEQWKCTHGVLVLQHVMRHKFSTQHPELRDQLLATENALLVQAYDRDSFYAAGLPEVGVREWAKENDGKVLKFPAQMTHENVKYVPLVGKGKNVLGVLAMHIRNLLRTEQQQQTEQQQGLVQPNEKVEQALPAYDGYGDSERQDLSPGFAKVMSTLDIYDDDDETTSCNSGAAAAMAHIQGKENSAAGNR